MNSKIEYPYDNVVLVSQLQIDHAIKMTKKRMLSVLRKEKQIKLRYFNGDGSVASQSLDSLVIENKVEIKPLKDYCFANDKNAFTYELHVILR